MQQAFLSLDVKELSLRTQLEGGGKVSELFDLQDNPYHASDGFSSRRIHPICRDPAIQAIIHYGNPSSREPQIRLHLLWQHIYTD